MDQIKLTKPRPSHFETYHFFFVRVSSFLSLFCIFSLVLQRFNNRVFSCFWQIAENPRKIHKNNLVCRFPWNWSYADWQVLPWVTIHPRFYCSKSLDVRKWPAEQRCKTSNLESANKNIGHFPSQGSYRFWSRPSRSFFQLTWLSTIES